MYLDVPFPGSDLANPPATAHGPLGAARPCDPAAEPALAYGELSRRALSVLVGRHHRGRPGRRARGLAALLPLGPALSERELLAAAARCTRAELLAKRGVGRRTVDEIEAWLARHGRRLWPAREPVQAALARAITHLEAVVEGRDEHATLHAFLALPELRRALRAHPLPTARG